MSKHTPTPWKFQAEVEQSFGGGPKRVKHPIYTDGGKFGHPATATSREDAAFIVRACNAHEALVEALEDALEYIAPSTESYALDKELVDQIRAALAKAQEETD